MSHGIMHSNIISCKWGRLVGPSVFEYKNVTHSSLKRKYALRAAKHHSTPFHDSGAKSIATFRALSTGMSSVYNIHGNGTADDKSVGCAILIWLCYISSLS